MISLFMDHHRRSYCVIHMIHMLSQGSNYRHYLRDGTFLKDYIEFFHGKGCFSFAGREGKKQRTILAPYCAEEHTLIHEVSFLYIRNNFEKIFRSFIHSVFYMSTSDQTVINILTLMRQPLLKQVYHNRFKRLVFLTCTQNFECIKVKSSNYSINRFQRLREIIFL